MHILVIAPDRLPLPPIEGGSVETVMHNLFSRMSRIDRITAVSCAHPRLPREEKKGRLTHLRFPYPNERAYLRSALKRLSGRRFDIIQIDNRPSFVPAVRRAFPRTPIVLSLHSLHFLSRMGRKRANAVLRDTNGVTCVSAAIARKFKARFPAHAGKFASIHPGVDAKKFRPRPTAYKRRIRRKYGVSGTYNLLFVGRIVRRKGLHTLVQAAAKLRKARKRVAIVAVGASWPGVKKQTPYMKKVRRLARRSHVPLVFTGYLPPGRVHEAYHLGDLFVCPTQYEEGFACVNTEAMASGVPLVSSARGGIREVVRHGRSGWLVEAYKSPEAFARAMRRIMSDPKLAERLARGGRKRVVSRFGWDRAVRKRRAYYRKLA